MPVEMLPDTQNPLDENQPLWRYTKLSTLLLLLQGTAFFPSVAKLRASDPLEGIFGFDSAWLFTALIEHGGETEVEKLQEWLHSQATDVEKLMLKTPAQEMDFGNDLTLEKIYTRELAKRRAVWCWFASRIESAAMWSIYGPGGVAICTTKKALVNALPPSEEFQISRIRYIETESLSGAANPENPLNNDRLHRPHLYKRREYEHEQEVRVVTRCKGSTKSGILIDGIDWKILVEKIVISPLTPFAEAEAVISLLERFDWPKHPHDICRSSLLGHLRIEEATSARLDKDLPNYLFPEDENLPSLIQSL